MTRKNFHIIKSSGHKEPFSLEKYRRSLKRSNVSPQEIEMLIQHIQPLLREGITTQELYKKTHELLKTANSRCASIYSLKEGLRLLGPDGFHFEKIVAHILEKQGYTIKANQELQGKCVVHEVDILAYKGPKSCILVECKFHNKIGDKSNVKVPLYIKARFEDILATKKIPLCGSLIATNTQFTLDAIDYAQCEKIALMAWGYPANNGIETLIEKHKLFPITILTHLEANDRKLLLSEGFLLCSELIEKKEKIKSLGIAQSVINTLLKECESIFS